MFEPAASEQKKRIVAAIYSSSTHLRRLDVGIILRLVGVSGGSTKHVCGDPCISWGR